MNLPISIYAAAALSAGVTTTVALPIWRRWCVRTGLVDDPGERKIHSEPIPLAGGLAVMTGLLLPTLTGALLLWFGSLHGNFDPNPDVVPSPRNTTLRVSTFEPASADLLRHGLSVRSLELSGIFVGALGMLILGLLDDKQELRPGPKFLGQFLIALLVATSGLRITLFVHSALFHYAITILWIVAVINAFNFMDNMNGLCAGLGAIGAWYFGAVAAVAGQYLVALIAFLTFGALFGFLPYNFPRARAFLGDAGSHLVGYLLAILAILPHFYTENHPRRWAVLIPLLVLAVPLLDMAYVVLLRCRLGRPFYVGDTNHLSHRLVRLGFSQPGAVLVIWLAAAILGGLVHLF